MLSGSIIYLIITIKGSFVRMFQAWLGLAKGLCWESLRSKFLQLGPSLVNLAGLWPVGAGLASSIHVQILESNHSWGRTFYQSTRIKTEPTFTVLCVGEVIASFFDNFYSLPYRLFYECNLNLNAYNLMGLAYGLTGFWVMGFWGICLGFIPSISLHLFKYLLFTGHEFS